MTFELLWAIMEHIGVFAFAISGAIVAINKEADIFGVVFISFVTSFGGGILRDVFLGMPAGTPLFFTESYVSLIVVCFLTSLSVFFFAMLFKRKFVKEEKFLDSVNNYIDAIGIGAFTVSGAMVAINAGHADNPFVVIIMGMTACIGGGMIRDLIFNDIPFVLVKRIYALATAAGAGVFYVIQYTNADYQVFAMIVGAITTIAIRVLATIFKWDMPKAIVFKALRTDSDEAQEENLID